MNADPEAARRARAGTATSAWWWSRAAGELAKPFVVHVLPRTAGSSGSRRARATPDDLDELEPAYVARAPYSVWKGLLTGRRCDPVEAVLRSGSIRVQGDLQPLVERLPYKGVARARARAELATGFVDAVADRGRPWGLRSDLKKQAMSLSQKAMEKLFADEKRAMQIADAIGQGAAGQAGARQGPGRR